MGVGMAVVHKNWDYCTISCNIKVFFTDVMFDNQAYVDTTFVLQMTYVISLNQQQIYKGNTPMIICIVYSRV